MSDVHAWGLTLIRRHFAVYFLPLLGGSDQKAARLELSRIIRDLGSGIVWERWPTISASWLELGLCLSGGFFRANNLDRRCTPGDGKRFVARADEKLTASG
jgi:hypothetical protein